jgi:hypothetical protein
LGTGLVRKPVGKGGRQDQRHRHHPFFPQYTTGAGKEKALSKIRCFVSGLPSVWDDLAGAKGIRHIKKLHRFTVELLVCENL